MRRFWIFCVLAVFFPYVATLTVNGSMKGIGMERFGEGRQEGDRRIYLDRQGQGYVDVEEYLTGVVARQMPADYPEEALKAQAIIARTCIYRQMGERREISESELILDHLKEEQMEKMWGKSGFLEYYQKIRGAVEETRGKVIMYEGEYIEPLFHRVSAGRTRDGIYPYLVSVDSRGDLEAENYMTVMVWTPEEFTARIRRLPDGESVTKDQIPDSLQLIGREEAGYVTDILIGSHGFDGEAVREALELPSAAYTLENYEGSVRALCRGWGHGYGMSQYGAGQKAEAGMSAEEILQYYYQDIEIFCSEP